MSDPLIKECRKIAERARAASRILAAADSGAKNAWLLAAADTVEANAPQILAANERDVAVAPGFGLTSASIDRLRLAPKSVTAIADGLRQVAALPDPVGEVREDRTRPNGLHVQKIGAPLGVVFFVYESRPNVTADAAALCVKSGNAVILRGGKEAAKSNLILHSILAAALPKFGLPADAVQLVLTPDRNAVGHFLKLNEFIDLCIPRGGEGLIRRVAAEATMPVLKHYQGNCHVYVDAAADLDMAERVILNAKCQRPGTCNAAESVLVHAAVAETFVPRLVAALQAAGVEVRGCHRTEQLADRVIPATVEDYAAEFLALIISMKVVPNLDAAVEHITRFGSGHTDAIISTDPAAVAAFTKAVDTAAVVVNASTRFNDGFELGLGAEIGISTDKFHARGPCGLRELTTYKYVVTGTGHVRE